MAPPSAVADLTSTAITSSLSKHNQTASVSPAVPIQSKSESHLADLDPSKLKINLTAAPKSIENNASGTTDHWITARWSNTAGWEAPELRPYTRMDIWPTASALHYATECFEGMKVYRGYDNKIRLFRSGRNSARMLLSSQRVALPSFSPNAFEELCKILVAYECKKWLPEPGSFSYLRPTMIGTGRSVGIQKPTEALFFIILSHMPRLDGPMKLLASKEDTIRAWPGGFGYAKVGANYGPSLMALGEAKAKGFHQILWLFGQEGLVTEAGASNFFAVIRVKYSKRLQLITAPLDDKIILDGVTRRSVLELSRERLSAGGEGIEALDVVERKYSIHELIEAHKEGRLVEAFAAGTAYFIAPVVQIQYKDVDMVPTQLDGTYMKKIKNWLTDIMYGRETHEWGVVVKEKEWAVENASESELEELMQKIRELKNRRGWETALDRVKEEDEQASLA